MKHNVVNQYPISGRFHLMCDLCSFVNVIIYGSVKSDLRRHKYKVAFNQGFTVFLSKLIVKMSLNKLSSANENIIYILKLT